MSMTGCRTELCLRYAAPFLVWLQESGCQGLACRGSWHLGQLMGSGSSVGLTPRRRRQAWRNCSGHIVLALEVGIAVSQADASGPDADKRWVSSSLERSGRKMCDMVWSSAMRDSLFCSFSELARCNSFEWIGLGGSVGATPCLGTWSE